MEIVESILKFEKANLQADKERLSRLKTSTSLNKNNGQSLQKIIDATAGVDFLESVDPCNNAENYISYRVLQNSSVATKAAVLPAITMAANALTTTLDSESFSLPKSDKNQVNNENLALKYEEINTFRRTKIDDMEQWVTDTFYSYFPGFNNEYQKRQNYLRDRQLEFQQNFIKHQMAAKVVKNTNNAANIQKEKEAAATTQLQAQRLPIPHSSDKTNLEIIVNNPDYVAKNVRPGSARQKLLQDLQHTEISEIVNSDVITDRNRRSAELELARKKEYQKELMAQIEEKRRSIEIIRERDRHQEEALTRKLQEQLKTIRLGEELEKEKLRMDKIRFDSEQNRLMREHLLKKLENDAKSLRAGGEKVKPKTKNNKNSPLAERKNNKVYQYFTNSARHEYRHRSTDQFLGARIEDGFNDFDLELLEISANRKKSVERECFHLMEKICPLCNAPLKRYESCCLKCDRRLPHNKNLIKSNMDREAVCENCQRLYTLCDDCESENDICRACHQKRKVCMSCRRNLCSFCLEEVATGRDAEKDDNSNESQKESHRNSAQSTFDSPESERSFQILEVKYPKPIENNSAVTSEHSPPFSMNLDRNSIFHPKFSQNQKLNLKQLFNVVDNRSDMDEIRSETNKRLSRYMENYGDLAAKDKSNGEKPNNLVQLHDQGTQTISDDSRRRDVVMVEQNNLSMPLLREMPKMTRKETAMESHRVVENLARRWEVPVVQKRIITGKSPRVLTQLGAIRKQLQTEKLQLDY